MPDILAKLHKHFALHLFSNQFRQKGISLDSRIYKKQLTA